MTSEAQNWVWIASKESYLDANGNDAEHLDPASGLGGEGLWWTCHKDTKPGDLVLLYRTAPQSDIAYLFEAASDARRLGSQPDHGVVTLRALNGLIERALVKEAAEGALPFVQEAKEELDDAQADVAAVYEALRRYEWRLDEVEQARADLGRQEGELIERERREGLAAVQEDWDRWSEADEALTLVKGHAEYPALDSAQEKLAWEVFRGLDMPVDTYLETETEYKGRWVCAWEPRYKFTTPVPLSAFRADGWLTENWNALRADFKGSVFRFDPDVWERVINVAVDQGNPGLLDAEKRYSKAGPSDDIVSEHQVRDALALQPDALGLGDLVVYKDPEQPERVGVEYPCPDVGIIDLLLNDADGNFTVVELKIKRAGEAVIGQVAKYMGWVSDNLAGGGPVTGVVVSDGVDTKYEAAAPLLSLTHIEVSEVKTALGL